MNTDFLLDAIGRIDDELILDAEQAVRPGKKRGGKLLSWRYLGGIAAAAAVCVGLWAALAGGILPRFWMMGGAGNAPGAEPNGAGADKVQSAESTGGEDGSWLYSTDAPPSTPGSSLPENPDAAWPGASGAGTDPGAPQPEPSDPPAGIEPSEEKSAPFLIHGRPFTEDHTAVRVPRRGTALGVLVWEEDIGNDAMNTDSGEELFTSEEEYAGCILWQSEEGYALELSDGTLIPLVPAE